MSIRLLLLLIYDFAFAFPEEVIPQCRDLVSGSHDVAQVVTSYECAVFNGGYPGRQRQCAAQASATAESPLSPFG